LPYLDTDHTIVKETGASINEIFSKHGEPHFRDLESKTLREIDVSKSQIVSTGGGLPISKGNIEYMLDHGVVVYLKAKPEDIVERLVKGKYKRPAIKSLSISEIRDKLDKMLNDRSPIYEKAHLIYVRSKDLDADSKELSTYLKLFL